MDGLDLALCDFSYTKDGWKYELRSTQTRAYPPALLSALQGAKSLTTNEILELDKLLGGFFAECVLKFIKEKGIDRRTIDAIASHGHTVYHQPNKGYTLQIGCGDTLSVRTGIPVINDFRQKDVIEGGQGAPLVPIGDALLFTNVSSAFLNIGGFCNVCFVDDDIQAYDICPGNLPLNALAEELGQSYDRDGALAASGKLNQDLFEKLNALPFYSAPAPKSLGTEWLDCAFQPLLMEEISTVDKLRTVTEHIAWQIACKLNEKGHISVLVTGGGTKNNFLLERLRANFTGAIIVPAQELIDFKEALIFGFLGALYLADQTNCIASVTGAKRNVKGGVLHLP